MEKHDMAENETDLLCDAKDCLNSGEFRPTLLLFTATATEPGRALLKFVFCAKHKNNKAVLQRLTDSDWRGINETFERAGLQIPVRTLTDVEWADLNPPPSASGTEPDTHPSTA